MARDMKSSNSQLYLLVDRALLYYCSFHSRKLSKRTEVPVGNERVHSYFYSVSCPFQDKSSANAIYQFLGEGEVGCTISSFICLSA